MKIVHLLGWYFPDAVGGTEVYVQALCRRMRGVGHEVLVAAPIATGAATGSYLHDGITVFRYAISRDPSRDEAYGRVPVRGADAFYDWLSVQRPDLLHVHSFSTGVSLPELREAKRLGIRVVATCHLPGLGFMCRTGELMQWGRTPCDGIVLAHKCAACNLTRLGMPQPAAWVAGAVPVGLGRALRQVPGRLGTTLGMSASVMEYAAMQDELFALVDRFVVLNDTARRMLVANGSPPEKLIVNRLGVSHAPTQAKPGPDQQPTTTPVRLGYVGRLHSSKGLIELVRAARAIPSDVSFVLEIRGPDHRQEAASFKEQLRQLAAGDARITFLPGVRSEEVLHTLAKLDALLCPSIWFENGPTVALEANAVGTPVLGSGVGNLCEIIDDGVNGRLVPAGDVAAWSRALEEVARNPAGTIDRWRLSLSFPRTMDEIARDYLKLYGAA
ncbi:MAG TPA: glycosyltransferase [Vicinamibacterales bacterium]